MSRIRRVHVPLLSPNGIIPHLGAPHHWKEGRSAKCLIDQWWTANDLPKSVRAILDQASIWANAELIDSFAERCTNLGDGRPSHSQSDLLAVLGLRGGLGILSIEAKVDEGFDKTVDEWRKDGSSGKGARLEKLCQLFDVDSRTVGVHRYQLFHRTASAVIEAKRYRAVEAAMIIQSWSEDSHGFADFQAFSRLLGIPVSSTGLFSNPIKIDGVNLRVGWSAEIV